MPVNVRNAEMVGMLRGDFQARYEPQFAWKSAVSQHQALPGLRGFWPTSSMLAGGDLEDLSGQGHTLTYNGSCLYRQDNLAPNVALDGVGDYFNLADPGANSWMDIIGTEAYINNNFNGLTLGGWFRFTNVAGATEYMISKWDVAGNQRSYALLRNAAGNIVFAVSNNGIASVTVASTTAPPNLEWFFAAGRYDPGTELKVWYNTETNTNVAAIPANLHAGTADFFIGGRHGGLDLLSARLSMQWLCAQMHSDAIVGQTFQQNRAMWGV